MARDRNNNPMGLLHGDIVIATAISHYPPHIGGGKQSQDIGDMLIVNNPHPSGFVQGQSLMPGTEGLGTSLHAGTYRLAKPSDKYYVMTVQEWDRYQPERVVRALYNLNFGIQLAIACGIAMYLIKVLT
jgi:hypothetical protein